MVFYENGGIYKPLGGHISWVSVEGNINGTIVIDAFIRLPLELGVLKSEVKLIIKGGRITDIARENRSQDL